MQGSAVYVFGSATVNPGEATQKITSLIFTVSGLKDGADEKITVDGITLSLGASTSGTTPSTSGFNAVTYNVSVTGSTATVILTKTGDMAASLLQTLLTGLTYQNTNLDNPTPGLRVFDVTSMTDNSGSTNATSTFAAGTNSSSVLVTALNDIPTFVTKAVTTGLSTSNSLSPDNMLNIPMRGFKISDIDGGNSIEMLSFTMTDLLSPASPANAPLNLNFPSSATSMYATKTSDNTYYVYGTVDDLNNWLQQPNAISYMPRGGFSGIAKLSALRVQDALGGFSLSNTGTTDIQVNQDTQAPQSKTAVLSSEDNRKIILHFDEPLKATVDQTVLTNAFTIDNNSISTAAIVGSTVVLTTVSPVTAGVSVNYTDPGGTDGIQDAAGVHAITQTVNVISDSVTPMLSGSMVYYNGSGSALNKFVLNFNEDMSSVCAATNQFSVSIVDPVYPDRTGTVSAFTNTLYSGCNSNYGNKTVTFGILPAFLSPSASVSVTYTDTTVSNDTSAIQDLAGNDVPNMVLGAWTNDILNANNRNFTSGKTVLVVGGQGNDTMTGGAANDTFIWFAGDAGTTGAVDIVKNFTAWNGTAGEKLDISKLLTNNYVSGTSTLSQWVTSVTNNASGAPTGVSSTNTKIVIDVDGQPAAGAAAGAAGTGTVTQTIWLDGVNLNPSGASLDALLATLKSNGVLIA